MRIDIPWTDIRHQITGQDIITNIDTGEVIGTIQCFHGTSDGKRRLVKLFGRYSGYFTTHEECHAFAQGVASVVEHVVEPRGKVLRSKVA